MLVKREVRLSEKQSLHLLPASRFADVANTFASKIVVTKDGRVADGKSPLDLVTLEAGPGARIDISVEGDDAEEALSALVDLVKGQLMHRRA